MLLVFFGSSVVGKVVSAAASSILARIFTPEEFGVLGVFTGILSMLARAASLGYPRAIVVPYSDRDAAGLAWLSFESFAAISGVYSLLFLLWGDPLASVFLESSAQPGITLP